MSPDDCSFVAGHLQTLHTFMNNYSKMLANYTRTPLDASRRPATQDANKSESKSLDCLKQLVVRSAEVFNLWKLLSEHQFYIITNKLSDVRIKQRILLFIFIQFVDKHLKTNNCLYHKA